MRSLSASLGVLATLIVCGTHMPGAAATPCDPRFTPVSGRLGYSQREDGRCEGEYRQPVNSRVPELVVAALWDRALSGPWPAQVPLGWSAGRTEDVRLEINALGERDYYRVDHVVNTARYAWPTAVISKTRLAPRDVGIVAYHDGARRLYLPVITSNELASTRSFHILLFSSADITSLSLSAVTVDTGATVASKTYTSPSLGSYLANRAINLELPLLGTGRYHLTISAITPGTRAVGTLAVDVQVP